MPLYATANAHTHAPCVVFEKVAISNSHETQNPIPIYSQRVHTHMAIIHIHIRYVLCVVANNIFYYAISLTFPISNRQRDSIVRNRYLCVCVRALFSIW